MFKQFALMSLALVGGNAAACSCPVQTLDDFTRGADSVYIATLMEAKVIPRSARDQWAEVEGKFRIDRVLKGNISAQFATLVTGNAGASCGVFMFVPAKYVIFTDRESNAISWCNGTNAIDPFEEESIAQKITAVVNRSTQQKEPDDVTH